MAFYLPPGHWIECNCELWCQRICDGGKTVTNVRRKASLSRSVDIHELLLVSATSTSGQDQAGDKMQSRQHVLPLLVTTETRKSTLALGSIARSLSALSLRPFPSQYPEISAFHTMSNEKYEDLTFAIRQR